ncbi:nicotinate-nucleotide adenylyltransferase [Calditerricola satsumensis]|uniref:Probable nicotinate-nucleotide adenylyltransferase n=2 Tax=Calditerricola satsumensis TaxID=373054 RepID=A0A8J3BFN6_9BACI|nr:nicotinate-nucleotide adenylyltransferase [Calditerricola satsumensis]GGK05689.1 putative nicotinate-nucleotide adenylyltransferase [Calditerricola satsumensis]
MKVGLFGGTFDPPHVAHLAAAERVRDELALDEVWFVVAGQPPHKMRDAVSPAHHRLRMVELAVADHPAFRVCDIELRRPGPSYTVDTVRALRRQHPDAEFYFIVGADMAADLPNWRAIDELKTLVRFVALGRPGYARPVLPGIPLHWVDMPLLALSATELRRWIRAGRSVRYLVPEAVRQYMEAHEVYGKRKR